MKVYVDESDYVAVFGKKPAGFGNWFFRICGKLHCFELMRYQDAKRKARAKAVELEAVFIFLVG